MKIAHNIQIIKSIILLSSAMFSLIACDKEQDPKPENARNIVSGNEVAVGSGIANSFIEFDNDVPVAIGIRMTKEALTNLPHDDHTAFLLELPDYKDVMPFKHITLDWEAHGHDPAGIYDLPHFDMHFYMITNEERLAIGSDDPKLEIEPEGRFIPEGYFPTPGFPQMGKHWLDGSSPELNGERFTQTFLIGSYDGKVSFYEPMITHEFLLSKPDVEFEIKQPEAFSETGYFPTKYAIEYDSASGNYYITLKNLVLRHAE